MVAWHPKGEVLVSCSYDDSIKVWIDCDGEWECAQTLAGPGLGHSSTVWGVAFSRDGSQMVSCSDDQSLRVWACSFDNPGDTLTSCVCMCVCISVSMCRHTAKKHAGVFLLCFVVCALVIGGNNDITISGLEPRGR